MSLDLATTLTTNKSPLLYASHLWLWGKCGEAVQSFSLTRARERQAKKVSYGLRRSPIDGCSALALEKPESTSCGGTS